MEGGLAEPGVAISSADRMETGATINEAEIHRCVLRAAGKEEKVTSIALQAETKMFGEGWAQRRNSI